MPKLRKTFTLGRQEIDRENKLVQPNAYRIGQNITVTRSESSDVGSVQPSFGNMRRDPQGFVIDPTNTTIGQVSDEENNRIYWFFVGGQYEGIYEFDLGNNSVNRILEFSRTMGILNFSINNTIQANVIGDLLVWNDNLNKPRKVNIPRFRGTEINPTVDSMNNSLVELQTPLIPGVNTPPSYVGDFISLSKRPPLFPPSVINTHSDNIYGVQGSSLYEQFVSFAYRYKYRDGETTAISPFSQAAFFPENFSFSRESGVLTSMVNRYNSLDIKFDVGSSEVTEIEVLFKESNSGNVFVLTTINKEENNIPSSTAYQRVYRTYPYDTTKVYRQLPSDQLTRIFDLVPIRAKAQEFVGNRLVMGNYVENYPLTVGNENGSPIAVDFNVSVDNVSKNETNLAPSRTCKSDRYYEVGIVYTDEEGRQTPVLVPNRTNTTNTNDVYVPFRDSSGRNRLKVDVFHEAPYWATNYRFFIKQTKRAFYNIAPLNIAIDSTTNRAYLRIPSLEDIQTRDEADGITSTLNKANRDDILLLKSFNNPNGRDSVVERREYRVEDVAFIDHSTAGISALTESGVYITVAAVVDGDLDVLNGITNKDSTIFETVPDDTNADLYFEYGQTFRCSNGLHTSGITEVERTDDLIQSRDVNNNLSSISVTLDWFNAFSYSNGVESMHVRDEFFGRALEQGAKASTISREYRQRVQTAGLIHSGIFDDNFNFNRLNEFNVSQPITWELEMADGSIQKLHQRNTNLIAFQEDKIKNIPINKNLVTTAGGQDTYSISSRFFNTETPYRGEYGISRNPESFATYGNNIYWVDSNRGCACRLGNDGITEISAYGLENLFRRETRLAGLILGGYDQFFKRYFVTLRNPGTAGDLGSDLSLFISSSGCPDPQSECRRDTNILNFQQVYLNVVDADLVLSTNDVVFVDQQRQTKFNGNFRWYRLREGTTQNPTFERAVQISPDGIITAIITSCSTSYPQGTPRPSFNITSESFSDEYDACENGIIDSIAYFGCPIDSTTGTPTMCTLMSEPEVGNIIYEGKDDLIPSSRTGWFIISEGSSRTALNCEAGVVLQKVSCSEIELGRRRIQGSGALRVIPGELDFDRNVRLCNANFAETTYFWNGANDRPVIGDILFTSNTTNTLASGTRFYAFEDGYFVRLNADSAVDLVGDCFTRVCTNNVEGLFTQSTSNPYQFTFNGLGELNSRLQGGEIEWVVLGSRRYPETDTFVTNLSSDLFANQPVTLTLPQGVTIPEASSDVSVRIVRVCYNENSSATSLVTVYRTLNSGTTSTLCGATATEELFLDQQTGIYYIDNQRNTVFNGGGNTYGLADADNGNVDRTRTFNSDGSSPLSSRVFCSHSNLLLLSSTEATNDIQSTCLVNRRGYRSDTNDFSTATELIEDDGLFTIPSDGLYSNRVIARRLINGTLQTAESQGCNFSLTGFTAFFGGDEQTACHGSGSVTIFTNNDTLDASTTGIYTDANLTAVSDTGYYANQTTDVVAYWDSSTETLTPVTSCPLQPIFTFENASIGGTVVADGTVNLTANSGSILSFTSSATDFSASGNGGSFARVSANTDRAISVTVSVPTGFRNEGSTVQGTYRTVQPSSPTLTFEEAGVTCSVSASGTITINSSIGTASLDATRTTGLSGNSFPAVSSDTVRNIGVDVLVPSGYFNEGDTIEGVCTTTQSDTPPFTFSDAVITCSVNAAGSITHNSSSGTTELAPGQQSSYPRVNSATQRSINLRVRGTTPVGFLGAGTPYDLTGVCVATQPASSTFSFNDAGVSCSVDRDGNINVNVTTGTLNRFTPSSFSTVSSDTTRTIRVFVNVPSGFFNENQTVNGNCVTTQSSQLTTFGLANAGISFSVNQAGTVSLSITSGTLQNTNVGGTPVSNGTNLGTVSSDTTRTLSGNVLVPSGFSNSGQTITITGISSVQPATALDNFDFEDWTGQLSIDRQTGNVSATQGNSSQPVTFSPTSFDTVTSQTSRDIMVTVTAPTSGFGNSGGTVEGTVSVNQEAIRTLSASPTSLSWTNAQAVNGDSMTSTVTSAPIASEWTVGTPSGGFTATMTNNTTLTVSPPSTVSTSETTGSVVLTHSQNSEITQTIDLTIDAQPVQFGLSLSSNRVSLTVDGDNTAGDITVTTTPTAGRFTYSTDNSWIIISTTRLALNIEGTSNFGGQRVGTVLVSHQDDNRIARTITVTQAAAGSQQQ